MVILFMTVCTSLITKLMLFNGTNPNGVIVLDDCSVHHVDEVASLDDCTINFHYPTRQITIAAH